MGICPIRPFLLYDINSQLLDCQAMRYVITIVLKWDYRTKRIMLIHLYVILYCLCNVFIHVADASDIQRDTYCYGDSSHANNLVDISCTTGVIQVLDVITASKPSVLGCPAEDHEYTPAEQEKCCTYNSSDCMASFTGNTDSYYNCSGRIVCKGVPIVFQQSNCNNTYPRFSNYLIIEYRCVLDGLLNGACSTTSDCVAGNTVCSNSVCKCRTNFSEFEAVCIEDGIPNGACFADNTCSDINAYCSQQTSRCSCRAGYTEDQQQCIQVSSQVERPGFCYGDNSHANNLINVTCTSGVIYVMDILTGWKPTSSGCPENDQVYTPALQESCCTYNASNCISSYTGQTDAYFACSGKTHCEGIPIVRQQQNDCEGPIDYPRFSNYLIFEYVCVPEGQIHGSCNSSEVCVDRNSECYNASCQCVEGFSDQEHSCWEDGTAGVDCLPDQTCLDPHAICSIPTNTCVCISGFSLIDGACVENCTSNTNCSLSQTECSNGVCVCEINHSFVYGECKQDEEVGGRCSHGGTCRDTNAECASNNICGCKDGYSLVESTCKQDGALGGICGTTASNDCMDDNTECVPSENGLCVCVVGYQNVSGICKLDGCVGCTCERDGDCRGSNIECGPDLTCRCIQGYSEVEEVCRLDGSLSGNCLADNTCSDIHAICINGRCQCNDVKNYVTDAGVCVRDDGYLNGNCDTTVTCKDENAYCEWATGLCSCKNNFVEVNGVCEQGDTSAVTACPGASPYNTLVPDCDRESFAVETRTYNRSKLTASGCYQMLDSYNHTYYMSCCTFGQDDCTEENIGIGDCSPVYYTVTEYICLQNKQLLDVETDTKTNGTDIGLTKDEDSGVPTVSDPTSVAVYNCSVQASCLTDINVFVLRNTLRKVNNVCSCNVSIIRGGSMTELTCDGPVVDHSMSIFRAINGFVQVQISYRVKIQGGFTILFRAVDRNAILTAHCGRGAKRTGISNLDTCGQIGTGNEILEVNEPVDTSGPEVGFVPPGYKNGTSPDWSAEPSVYHCSIQASCQTDIDVFVLINTLEKVNGICSTNVSIIGDGSSTEVTCDEPRASRYNRIYTVSSGFFRAEIQYQDSIQGHFLILFRASHPDAILTLACGAGAKFQRNHNLSSCDELGTGDKSLEVHEDVDIDSGTEVDIPIPGYGDGDVPSTVPDPVTYQCSVQASCVTEIKVFVLLNTLETTNNVCSCNITMFGDDVSTDVNCDGPAANRYAPVLSTLSGFSRIEIQYHSSIRGSFILRFQAVEPTTKLVASCGTKAKLTGIQSLPVCTEYGKGAGDIEVNDDDDVSDTEVGIVSPGYMTGTEPDWSTETTVYRCSIQASCLTDIDVYVWLNTLQKVNNVCSCNVSMTGGGRSSEVTCDGPSASRYTKLLSVTGGFILVDIRYHGRISGNFVIAFRGTDRNAFLTASCGNRAKVAGIPNLPTCRLIGTGTPSVPVDSNEDSKDGSTITEIIYPNTDPPLGGLGEGSFYCSVQATCVTFIYVHVLLNTLQKVGEVCTCNITINGQDQSTEVTCDGPAANWYTPIMTESSGFLRVEIKYRTRIQGSFVIRFRATERNAKLMASCGNRAKICGIQNLQTCIDPGTDHSSLPGNSSDERTGSECSVTSPNYPSDNVTSTSNGVSVYYCSVQASCQTAINVFVLLNTLQQVDGVCSCNITLNAGSGMSSDITCDGPPGNYFTPIFSVVTGFVRTDIHYRDTIYGNFVILYRAAEQYAKLTVSCGNKAQEVGRSSLGNCLAHGKGGSSVEVHKNETRNDTDVSITNPDYRDGPSVPSTTGVHLYQCSVQTSCLTRVNVFLLLNTLQQTDDICQCNITLAADGVSTNITCDGPPHNRYMPVLSTSTGFVKVDITYSNDLIGDFVIEFRAVDRDAVLSLGCGTRAKQTGFSNLDACIDSRDGKSTIEVDDDNSTVDTEVSVIHPSGQLSGPHSYTCSVQASCRTTIEVYVETNALQEINGLCSCFISVMSIARTEYVTCDGPGSNRFSPMFTEPTGFLRLHVNYTDGIRGKFRISFKGADENKLVTVSCGTQAVLQGWPALADCTTEGGDSEENGGGGSSSGSSLILIIIPVIVVVLLLVLIILCWVFRHRIRSKLCPQKQKPSVEPLKPVPIIEKPVVEGPLPMNTKFPGRTPETGTRTMQEVNGTASSMTMADYLFKEEIDKENSKNLNNNTLIVPKKGTEDTVVRTKFNPKVTLQEELATMAHVHEEEEKMKEEKQQRKEKRRLKKLKKKLRKAQVGITSANSFRLPTTLDQEPVGTYRPLVDDSAAYSGDVPPPSIHHATRRLPPLPVQGTSSIHTAHGSLPGPGLPDFSAVGLATDHPRPGQTNPRLPPLAFQSSSLAWKKAGLASVVAGKTVVKKKTLEIISIDDPKVVERSELE